MTDRYAGFIVTLERDIRDDDAEATIAALRQIRGVTDVRPVVSDPALEVARAQARGELIARIGKTLDDFYV